jgi:hypothetical protein
MGVFIRCIEWHGAREAIKSPVMEYDAHYTIPPERESFALIEIKHKFNDVKICSALKSVGGI